MENLEKKWARCLEIIKAKLGEKRFEYWFGSVSPVSFHDPKLVIQVPSFYFVEEFESDRFYDLLKTAFRTSFGAAVEVEYRYPVVGGASPANVNVNSPRQSRIARSSAPAVKQADDDPRKITFKRVNSNLNASYNFENYCVGDSNRLPYAIAKNITEHPENTVFNPFFLHGSVGVGKTHLVQAIGIRLKETNPNLKVLYVTYREFQTQFSQASIDKEVPKFVRWYEDIDVLIVDDLQEIANKEKTMDVFFAIFNHLHQNNKKLIFTSDRAPMHLEGVTDRLIDRFKWGVVEELKRPDRDLRMKILTMKAAQNGLSLPADVIEEIAAHTDGSVREIEGVVSGIITRSITLNSPITRELALDVLHRSVKKQPRAINFDMIVEATAEYYRLNPDVIFSQSRVRDIAEARQLIMYLASRHTNLSSSAIGTRLKRSHATVIYGIAQIRDRIPFSRELQDAIASIEATLARMRG